MNLQRPNANDVSQTSNRSRSVVPGSGLCTRCIDGCRGNCEVFQSTFRGREVIYPGPFGEITAGADKDYPVDYSHLNIQGYALGGKGLPEGVVAGPDTCTFPDGQHRDGVRLGQQGEDARCRSSPARWARPRSPARTGSTSPSARPSPASPASAARTSAASTRSWSSTPRARSSAPPTWTAAIETYQRYHDGYGEHPRADERRGHAAGRGRVRHRQARPRDHRAEVGPGRQVHRRRDQGRLARAGPGAAEARLHRHPRSVRPGHPGGLQGRRHQAVRAAHPAGLRRRGGLPGRVRAAARSSAPSASR